MGLVSTRRLPLQLLGLALLFGAGPQGAQAQDGTAVVRGSLSFAAEGLAISDAGPIVAYLEPLSVETEARAPRRTATLLQKDARFRPGLLVISAGQSVEMPNQDAIYHNVFSYSKPNDFDLGLYPPAASRTVKFRHAGVVKVYCSIHESMTATLLVTPTPDFARVKSSGKFEIGDVAPGRYKLHLWSEKLPETSRTLSLAAGDVVPLKIVIGSPSP